jgi:lysophospholipase L1-like esterase
MEFKPFNWTILLVVSSILTLFVIYSFGKHPSDKIILHNGDKIAFLGDSITQFGAERPDGYVNLVLAGLKALHIEVIPIFAGVSGNTSKDMVARIDRDVLRHKPSWMLLSCGVNDIWHGAENPATGVELPKYKANMTRMIDKAQAAGIKVGIMSITVCTEDPKDPRNLKVKHYTDFLRQTAIEKKCLWIDVGNAVRDEIAKRVAEGQKQGQLLTEDGVHMNAIGNKVMAETILYTFGFSDDEMKGIRSAWEKIPATKKH